MKGKKKKQRKIEVARTLKIMKNPHISVVIISINGSTFLIKCRAS